MIIDYNRTRIPGDVTFHFQHSLRGFNLVYVPSLDKDLFVCIDKGEAFTFYDLEYEGLYFYPDPNHAEDDPDFDEDFLGVSTDW